jgi:hypothetical protein
MDLCRSSGADLESGHGLCLCFLLCPDDTHHRGVFCQAQLAHGKALRVCHPGRHVCLLLQQRSGPLADRAHRLFVLHFLFRPAADIGGSPVLLGGRRTPDPRADYHGRHRLVLRGNGRAEGQHVGGRTSVFTAGGRDLPVGVFRHHLGCHRRLVRLFPKGQGAGPPVHPSARTAQFRSRGRLDGRYDPDLHVRPHGDPEFAGVHPVEFRHQVPQAPGLAAGLHVHLRGGPGPFLLYCLSGLGAKILELEGVIAPKVDGDVVPMLMTQFLPGPVLGLVFLGAIAAIHSTAAPYIGTGGTILLRDVYWRYIRRQQASHSEQIWVNRALSTAVTLAAVVVSLTARDAIVMIGGFATAFGFVMYLLLLGVHWGWRFPSLGATLGMIAGIVACFLTYYVWRYPLSMHTAFWGLFAGLLVAYLCRGLGVNDSEETRQRQAEVRAWLDSVDGPSESGKKWRFWMKILVPVWFFFAIGPACLLGNKAFSFCGFPALWSWQIVWWILGIIMMWALCFKAEMSTTSDEQIQRADDEAMIVVKEV